MGARRKDGCRRSKQVPRCKPVTLESGGWQAYWWGGGHKWEVEGTDRDYGSAGSDYRGSYILLSHRSSSSQNLYHVILGTWLFICWESFPCCRKWVTKGRLLNFTPHQGLSHITNSTSVDNWMCEEEGSITKSCEEEKRRVEFGRRASSCPVPFSSPWQLCVPSGSKSTKEKKKMIKWCLPVPEFPSNRRCTACGTPPCLLFVLTQSFYIETLQSEQLILSLACLAGANTFWRDTGFPASHQKQWIPENLNFPRNLRREEVAKTLGESPGGTGLMEKDLKFKRKDWELRQW